jgi:hypothetical protein
LLHSQQLLLLEQLLWRGSPGRRRSRWAGPLRALLRGALAAAARSVVAEVADAELQYTQEGDVGPWCVGQQARTADALRVGVRLARLSPPGAAAAGTPAPTGGVAGASGRAGGQAATCFALEGVSASLLTRALRPAGGPGGAVAPASKAAREWRRQQPQQEQWDSAGCDVGDAQPGRDGWDCELVVLRQWFAHVTLTVSGNPPAHQQQQEEGSGAAAQPPGREERGGLAREQRRAAPALRLVVSTLGGGAAGQQQQRHQPRGHAAADGADADGGCHLSAAVSLKSLVLEASPEAAAVFLRLMNRWAFECNALAAGGRRPCAHWLAAVAGKRPALLKSGASAVGHADRAGTIRIVCRPRQRRWMAYSRFAPLWTARPSVPVRAAPALWWRHAGAAVVAECRRRLPVRRAELALLRRREYLLLYRAVHAAQPAEFIADPRGLQRGSTVHIPGELSLHHGQG